MATQASFLTVWARLTYHVWYVNWNKSEEYCHGENQIKSKNSSPLESSAEALTP